MKISKHARKQAQRRGIGSTEVNLVMAYGDSVSAGRGCQLCRISRQELNYLAGECPPMLWRRYRDRLQRLAAVVASDSGEVVTVMHRNKPIWKRFKPRHMQ
jgi:hypothetical protein